MALEAVYPDVPSAVFLPVASISLERSWQSVQIQFSKHQYKPTKYTERNKKLTLSYPVLYQSPKEFIMWQERKIIQALFVTVA